MKKRYIPYKITIFSFVFSVLTLNIGYSQDEEDLFSLDFYKKVSASYIFGGQLYNNSFIYDPGYSLNVSIGTKLNRDIKLGVGSGLINLSTEHFTPVFAELIAYKGKKDNTPFISFQAGYAWVTDSQTDDFTNYKLQGGVYFNAGMGRKIDVNEHSAILISWSYCHQFASMEYKLYDRTDYHEPINYNMLFLSVAYLFN